ncbi:RICIN domain-containing protein [Streptomyces sp. NPDC051987]|uniref:RICIN domain-containing protein n=1 Tax=Streptomyces sp. NPDC051987 TaxID=3155808 RepID=UPI0034329F1A
MNLLHRVVSRPRRAVSAAAVALATVAAVAAGTGNAQADSSFTIHVTPNSSFGLLLDVAGGSTSPGGGVIQWYANGGANQNWTFYSYGNSTYEIINGNSNMCLSTDGVAGDSVYQMPCVGAQYQMWRTPLTPSLIGAATIYNPWSGLYLDVNGASPWAGASIDTWYWNGGSNQYFAAI